MIRRGAVAVTAAVLLSGCVGTVVGAAVDVVTLPVRVVGAGINAVVPSQKEHDRKRGKRERKAEEKARRDARRAQKAAARDAATNPARR